MALRRQRFYHGQVRACVVRTHRVYGHMIGPRIEMSLDAVFQNAFVAPGDRVIEKPVAAVIFEIRVSVADTPEVGAVILGRAYVLKYFRMAACACSLFFSLMR